MNIDYKTKKYGLIGNPIEKTLSPFIHNELYKILKVNSIYLTFNIKEDLSKAVSSLKVLGFKGYNVTIPYKKDIIKYLDYLDKEASMIGAVNTVVYKDNKLKGYNTDGLGFIRSLRDRNITIKNKNILVLGSGGASNSICMKLLEEEVGNLFIYNRTKSNANKLRKRLKEHYPNKCIEVCEISEVDKESIDILVNTSSVGMYPDINETPISLDGFGKNLIVYDIVYKPLKTKLIKDSLSRGYTSINGLEMLVNQGISSQEIWLNERIRKEDRDYILYSLKKHIGED